ncbi:phosphoenolpyruvate mutase [Bacillus sp. OV322]|nr:phosphoenolpyruvate mutase [Bacillus sp. OV322]
MRKTAQLRKLIHSDSLEFIMEAHSGLAAKIVEEAGFKGIWASGLSISAALGVRDNNEASWTQVLDVLEFMSDASSIPILLDGDTGYGNFNNARRLVKKLESRNIAGVCIEDKLFPKTNSFIGGEAQPLADIDEFCGKIKAMKDTQTKDDFVVVSRVEAFIAGWGLKEALRRAEAYRQAGTDAILMHSKRADSSEIEAFVKEWGNRLPVVIVPTKYYKTPTEKFRELGISLIIWANHNLRSSIKSMQNTTRTIFQDQSLINVEREIVTVNEVFRLQGAEELKEAEKKYLPKSIKNANAIILPRRDSDFVPLPNHISDVGGKSFLSMQVNVFNEFGIKDISVVGDLPDKDSGTFGISVISKEPGEETNELHSLYLAKEHVMENTIISYGDIIFKHHILQNLLTDLSDILIIADANADFYSPQSIYLLTDQPYSKNYFSQNSRLLNMSGDLKKDDIHGKFIGLWRVTKKGAAIVSEALEELSQQADFKKMDLTYLFKQISSSHPVYVHYIKDSWIDRYTLLN